MGRFDIGTYLRCTREAAGLTHPQVCDLPDGEQICSIENLSYIENGRRHPGPHTLSLLLQKLGKEKIFGECYLRTSEYEVLKLDKQLNILIAEQKFSEARAILAKLEAHLSTDYLTNRQYLAVNHAMLDMEFGDITPKEAAEFFTEIVRMTLPVFGTESFDKAFVTQREAVIILQIGNVYGQSGDYEKALDVLERTYANLIRYPDEFHYADGLYAVYMRAIIKWKGELGKIEEALELGEQAITEAFRTKYVDTLAGLLYAKVYNENEMMGTREKTTKERSAVNSGYEVAALIAELFGEDETRDFIRKKIQ